MLHLLWGFWLSIFYSRKKLLLENALFRQQLVIYQRSVKQPKVLQRDRIFLVWLSRVFSRWKESLVVVRPETIIGWQRQGFKLYWRWKSRRGGRPCIDWSLIKLIRQMHKENPLWSPQRIQGELAKLGLTVSENTILKYGGKSHTHYIGRYAGFSITEATRAVYSPAAVLYIAIILCGSVSASRLWMALKT